MSVSKLTDILLTEPCNGHTNKVLLNRSFDMQRGFFVERLINFFVTLAEAILVFRVLFRLFNANANASFVSWIYDTSDSLMAPFRGIFPPQEIIQGHILDVSALFAMLMYALVGYVLIALLGLLPQPSTTTVVKKR
jgi:uncharacterized protein YggT (Ycf19 family)